MSPAGTQCLLPMCNIGGGTRSGRVETLIEGSSVT